MAVGRVRGFLRELSRLLSERASEEGSDQQLLERFLRSRDESAFAALVERHGALVLGVCRSVLHQEQDAEDAFQATFLVLARKAGAIRKREALASWLYGVAMRTARKLRRSLAARRQREQRSASPATPQPMLEAALREVQAILHEEIERLPEKFRTPFVLCCLEGKSRADAARELGWKEGTLSGRIAQARAMLETRLARRGVVLTAALAATAIAPSAIAASAEVVVQNALTFAAGKACVGIAERVVLLAEGVVQSMFVTKMKWIGAAAMVALLLIGGAGLLARAGWSGDGVDAKGDVAKAPDVQPSPPALLPEGEGRKAVAPPEQAKAGEPLEGNKGKKAKEKQEQPKKVKRDNQPKPYRVIGDRRVDFPLPWLTFSADRKLLASVGVSAQVGAFPFYRVVVVDAVTGETVQEWPTDNDRVNHLQFSPDGKLLYAGTKPHDGGLASGPGSKLRVWDIASGKLIKDRPAPQWILSPDGKVLAINENFVDFDPGFRLGGDVKPAPSTYTLRLLDTSTWKEIVQLHDKDITLSTMKFTPDSKTLAIALSDYTIRFWDWQAKKERRRVQAPKVDPQKWAGGAVTMLEFSPDGTRLASVTDTIFLNSIPRKVDLWDVGTGEALKTVTGPSYPIIDLAFTPKGDRLAVAARQNYFNLIDLKTGEKLVEWERPGRSELAVEMHRIGATPDGALKGPVLPRLWNLASGEDIVSGRLPNEMQSLAISPDERTLAVGDIKGMLRFYDIESGNELRKLSFDKSPVYGLTYLPDGKTLAVHLSAGLRLIDSETAKPAPLKLFANALHRPSFAASPDGKFAAVAESGGMVYLWRDASGAKPTFIKLPHGVRHLQFTPDGNKLLAGSWDGVIQVIDAAKGELLKPIGREHTAMFTVSPDGKTVAAWHRSEKYEWDKHVTIWSVESGEEVGRVHVTPTAYNGMRFTPDGKGLWISSNAGIALFHVGTSQFRVAVQGSWPMAQSKTGRFVACKGDNSIYVWDVEAMMKQRP